MADRSSPETSCTTPSPTCPKVVGTDKQKPKDKSIKKDKKILCMACNSDFTEWRLLLRGSIHLFSGALTTDSGPISFYKCITVIAESENPQQGQRTLWASLFQSAEPQVRPPRRHGLGACSVMLAWHSSTVRELYCSSSLVCNLQLQDRWWINDTPVFFSEPSFVLPADGCRMIKL